MLSLYVDGPRWRAHMDQVVAATPGIVPVVKGNGYGFGTVLAAEQAARLGVRTVAVGLAAEVAAVRPAFGGDVLVLQPHLPGTDAVPDADTAVLRTVASPDAVRELTGHRLVVELSSSMHRFGLSDADLAALAPDLRRADAAGFAVHLPLVEPRGGRLAEVTAAVERVRAASLEPAVLWVSHLSEPELDAAREALTGVDVRPRVGTRLWLGSGGTSARSTVLAVHEVRRGERFGYRQHRASRPGHLVVAAGGTSHGIGLAAPTSGGVGSRVRAAGSSGLAAAGFALSPFRTAGSRRWFAEPPHMQVSLLWLPGVEPAPAVGSELDVDVRMTTTTFDRVVVS